MISWFSNKKMSMELISIEVEYMATTMASCKAIWLRKLITSLFD
jgi:hypothetical protein